MKITLAALAESIKGGHLAKFAGDGGLPIRTTFRLRRICKQAMAEFRTYEETRLELINKFAEKNEDGTLSLDERGNAKFADGEHFDDFNAEHAELLATEIEIDGEPFTIDDLAPRKFDAGEFLSANDLIVLEWLIAEDLPEKADAQTA